MSGDCGATLQRVIYEVLDATLTDIPVFDHVPQDQAFPYVVIGEGDAGEFDTDTEVGQEHRPLIHIYDRHRGKKIVKETQQAIRNALDNQPLDLTPDANLVFIYYEFSEVYLDPDGLTYHGVIRFRALTTEA